LTPDGWKLSLQRIPHGKNGGGAPKGVVFFQHGLVDNSAGICLNPPNESLPFLLAEAGFDMWLGNNRGNGISMENTKYSPSEKEFWDFSWDEMARIDLPTQINYVLSQTGKSKLTYIGHSEGTIQSFAGFLNATVASKVNLFIALAPVAWVGNIQAKIMQELAKYDADELITILGAHDFSLPVAIDKLLPGICTVDPKICAFTMNAMFGPTNFLNVSRESYYVKYEPNPTSVKNMAHWAQGVRTGKYERFDYGAIGNRLHYGQATPPEYDLTKFPANLPTALFCGGDDYLADPKDVEILLQHIPKPFLIHTEPEYAHMDPLWSVNANVRIYPTIIDLAGRYA
jgi:pimeloyl-ACP methyl ester carboxylesterase